MDARRLKRVVAKHACAIGERERHDNEITSLNRSNLCADVFDHTYRFVPHHAAGVAALHLLIRPQIASANARSGNTNDSISRLDDLRIGHVLDPNVASAIHHSCAHNPVVTPISKMPCRLKNGTSHPTSAVSRRLRWP